MPSHRCRVHLYAKRITYFYGHCRGQGQSGQMAGLAGGSAGGAGAAIGVLEILGVATGSANGSGTAHGNRGETIARFVYVVPSESRVYRVRGET